MKGGVIKRQYRIILIGNYFLFSFVGWHIGGVFFTISGFIIALLIDFYFPTYQWELTWHDIDLALNNIYKYGNSRCELCFRVGHRKVYIYRDERGSYQHPIRMAIRIPLTNWEEFFLNGNFHQLVDKFGGWGMYSNIRGKSYNLFTRIPDHPPDICKEVLKFLFEKAVGGLKPDIYAQSIVNSTKNIWLEHQDEETEEQKKRRKERMEKNAKQMTEECKRIKKEVITDAKKRQAQDKERRRKEREKRIKEKAKSRNK